MATSVMIKVEAVRLYHTPDHVGCHYIPERAISVEVSVDDTLIQAYPQTFGNDLVYFPEIKPGSTLQIVIKPVDKGLYPVKAWFTYREDIPGMPGRFDRDADTDTATVRAGIARPEGIDLLQGSGGRYTSNLFRGYLPTFDDVTDNIRQQVKQYAAKNNWHQAQGDPDFDIISRLEAPAGGHWMSDPPVAAGSHVLGFDEKTVDPQNNVRVFAPPPSEHGRPLPNVPGLVFVSMPKQLPSGWLLREGDDPLSCLFVIRPSVSSDYYTAHHYPYAMNWLWDAGLKYLGMLGLDPILQKHPDSPPHFKLRSGYRDKTEFGKEPNDSSLEHVGLAHQAAAAGCRVGLIMPLLGAQGLGRFDDAAALHTSTCELYAWELRSHELYSGPPSLGPCAISGFSFGNTTLAGWLDRNRGKLLADRVIRQVYSMDAPITGELEDQQLTKIIAAAEAWARRAGPEPSPGHYYSDRPKMIRVYNQAPAHTKLSGFKPAGTNFPRAPFVTSNGDERSFVSMPAPALTDTARGLDPENRTLWPVGYRGGQFEAHQIINSTAFVDALRRSGFPKL